MRENGAIPVSKGFDLGQDGDGFWADRTALVTGVSGFVGSWVAGALLQSGARVIGIVRDGVGGAPLRHVLERDDLTLVHGTLVDYPTVERVLNEYEVDTCFHLAAQAVVGAANRSPLSTFESNIRGTWTVLEACRQSRLIERVVVASSDKAYGLQPQLPYTEDSPLLGTYPYDASKACADILARSYAATYELPVAVARCANIYGGGDLNWSRLVPGTIRSVLQGEPPIIRSDGTPERDYVYALDAARAYLVLARRLSEQDLRSHAFNFGSGRPVSVLELAERIIAASGAAGLQPRVLGSGSLHGEIDRQYLDSHRAARVLGWTPETSLDDGLRLTLDWYRAYLAERGTARRVPAV